jgi:hypothetical protein
MSDDFCIHEMMVGYCSICNKKDESKVSQKRAGYGRAGDSSSSSHFSKPSVPRLRRGTATLGKIADFDFICSMCMEYVFEGDRISYDADTGDWTHFFSSPKCPGVSSGGYADHYRKDDD